MGYIIGLDLSLCNTGWVILDKNGKCVNSGTITTKPIPKKKPKRIKPLKEFELMGIRRWHYIKQKIDQVISMYKPKIAIIENYAYNVKKTRSVFQIGELGGIIKYLLFIRGINFYVCSPQSLKKYATGYGGGNKNIIIKEAYKKWGIELNTEHEVDAFVLAKVGYGINNYLKHYSRLKKYEIEVIETIIIDESMSNWIKGESYENRGNLKKEEKNALS